MSVWYGMTKNNFFNSREDLISMFLGLGVVVVVVILMFNFIVRRKGNISVPGINFKTEQNVLTTPGKINDVDNGAYEVVKGDSLWRIAENKYGNGFLWTKIASENKLTNGSVIEVGQKLSLPIISEAEIKLVPKPVVVENYQVKRGDSLWSIAVSQMGNGYKWTQIWNLNKNKIGNPDRLEIGMMLKLR